MLFSKMIVVVIYGPLLKINETQLKLNTKVYKISGGCDWVVNETGTGTTILYIYNSTQYNPTNMMLYILK